jgi:FkbM family methyltransferase
MKNILSFYKKHGFVKGTGIIKRYLLFHLVYKPFGVKKKWIKINGYHLLLDFSTEGISNGLYIMGSREILETEVVKKTLKKGDVCLDAGANIGYYCLLEAIRTKSKVYAFEPDKRNTNFLKKSIKKNKLKNIELYEMALSDQIGSQKIYFSNQSNLNTLFKAEKSNGITQIVKTTTIDQFTRDKKIDFIRMDIEGFEYEVFTGMKKILESKKPLKIMVEFHSPTYTKERDFRKKIKIMKKNKFKLKYLITQDKPYLELMRKKGYAPKKLIIDSPNIRALYSDVKMDDLVDLLGKGNLVRAGLFIRE